MEDIDRFLAKPKEVEILGKKYSITPLTVNELGSLTKSRSNDPKESREGSEELGYAILKKILPNLTIEQFKLVAIDTLDEVCDKFMKAFGQKKSSAEEKLIKKLKEKKDVGNTNN